MNFPHHTPRALPAMTALLLTGIAAIASAPAPAQVPAHAPAPADLVLLGARIYTADADRHMAGAMAVRGGRIVYVGDERGSREFIGPKTRVKQAAGHLVLPGLVDSHIHPITIAQFDDCDADNRAMDLPQLSAFVRSCIARYHTPPGHWISVRQWNYANGNRPTDQYPTMRAALDAATTRHPVHLLGSDGHHGAFNSAALAGARNRAGVVVGLTGATLASDFAADRARVGVDAHGEPDGTVNETLQTAIDGPTEYAADAEDFANLMRDPAMVTRRLNSVGITGMLDAALPQNQLPFYDALLASHRLTVRTAIAQFLEPADFRGAAGDIDFTRMLEIATRTRARYAGNPLIRADVVKLFVDGGLEGDPHAAPPTLPNGAVLRPFLQPIFAVDADGTWTVTGYVDTNSAECRAVRADPGATQSASAVRADPAATQSADAVRAAPAATQSADAVRDFTRAHGFHPQQCAISDGNLYYSREEILEFVKRFHVQGFALHMHVIGDRAARTAIDALEAARAAGGPELGRDGLAHLELAAPEDVARIGRDHIYVAFTYAWSIVDPEYDLSIVPFIDHVIGNTVAALHPADGYYERNAYPVRGVRDAGGLVVGGSDAAVETRDPRPFINMARAVTRRLPGRPALNPAQSISIRDAIDSYTISGARFLGWGNEFGSIEVGKSADFVIVDRDILELADHGNPESIEQTRVLETWFRGRRVYRRRVP